MTLTDVWDFVKNLQIADHVYMGKMDGKMEKSIGVYNSKHSNEHKVAIGGSEQESYGSKYVTFLIHWSKSPSETETAAEKLFKELQQARNVTVNNAQIYFVQLLTDSPVNVGTDDSGVYEMVVEAAIIFRKEI